MESKATTVLRDSFVNKENSQAANIGSYQEFSVIAFRLASSLRSHVPPSLFLFLRIGFMLILENLENSPFLQNVRENLKYSGSFLYYLSKSRKRDHLVSISFSLTIGMTVCKVVGLIAVSKCELYH